MGLRTEQIEVGGFDKNFSYLVYDEETKESAVVDPSGDTEIIEDKIKALALKPVAIWLTHTHFDHIEGIPAISKQYGDIHIYVHKSGASEIYKHGDVQEIDDHELIKLGGGKVKVLYTPGHIDDAVCFFISEKEASDGIPKIITGDTLFVGGCGRTSETRVKDLFESLQELKNLPPVTEVFPGHDYGDTSTSTIDKELETNKYLLAKNFNEFKELRLG